MEYKIILNNVNDAAFFAGKCAKYKYDIDYICGRYTVDAKSFMGILSVGLGREDCFVRIHTDEENILKEFVKDMELWM